MLRKLRIALAVCATVLICGAVYAQQPVVTIPFPVTSSNGSGTVTVTNTFQSIFAAATSAQPRKGCTIQNNGGAPMFVFFGAIAGASSAASISLQSSGASVNCQSGGIALQDQISITGTAGQAFFAAQQ